MYTHIYYIMFTYRIAIYILYNVHTCIYIYALENLCDTNDSNLNALWNQYF